MQEAGSDLEGTSDLATLDRSRVGPESILRAVEIQPRIRLSGVSKTLRRFWDRAETWPPQALRIGPQWEPEAGAP